MDHMSSYLEPGLLDALEEPGDPLLLVLERGGHQQHLLGRRGVEAHLAGRHALTRAHVLLVELGPATWRKDKMRSVKIHQKIQLLISTQ